MIKQSVVLTWGWGKGSKLDFFICALVTWYTQINILFVRCECFFTVYSKQYYFHKNSTESVSKQS